MRCAELRVKREKCGGAEGKAEEKGWMCKWKILPEVFFMPFDYSKFISNFNSIAHVYSYGSTSTWKLKSTCPMLTHLLVTLYISSFCYISTCFFLLDSLAYP